MPGIWRADAHQDWWGDATSPSSAASQYLQWVRDRNTAQFTWQNNVLLAFSQHARQQRDDRRLESLTLASAAAAEATTAANAAFDYLAGTSGVLGPAKLYLDGRAQIERNHAVNLAAAEYRRAQNANGEGSGGDAWSQYYDEVEQANDAKEQGLTAAQNTYAPLAAAALGTRLTTEANAAFANAAAMNDAVHTRRTHNAAGLFAYQAAESRQYVWITEQLAQLDASYWLFESSTLELSAAALAAGTSTASAWADFWSDQHAAYDDWSQTSSAAQSDLREDSAQAQAGVDSTGSSVGGGEVAIFEADRDEALQAINEVVSERANAINSAQQSTLGQLSAFGSGGLSTSFPELEPTRGLGGTSSSVVPIFAWTDAYALLNGASALGLGAGYIQSIVRAGFERMTGFSANLIARSNAPSHALLIAPTPEVPEGAFNVSAPPALTDSFIDRSKVFDVLAGISNRAEISYRN